MSSERGPLYPICAWASVVCPLLLAVCRIDGAENWAQDVAVVRALGLVQVGGEGVVSAALAGGLALLPLGNALWRLSLLSVLAVAVASGLVFRSADRLFAARTEGGRPVLALGAALMTGLGAAWQVAATSVGGPALAGALVLAWVSGPPRVSDGRAWLGHGFALGLLTLESVPMGFATAGCLLLLCLVGLRLPSLQQLGYALGALLFTVGVGLLPSWLQSGSSALTTLGLNLAAPVLDPTLDPTALPTELGLYLGTLAALGAFSLASLVSERPRLVALSYWVCLGLLVAVPGVQLAAVAALATLAAVGLGAVLDVLARAGMLGRRVGARALVVVHLGALLLIAEGGDQVGRATERSATRAWSEQAFDRMPASSLLLLSTPEAAWRIWSSRLTSGLRPDVVVVPTALLGERGVAADLLAMEPKLAPLIRDEATLGLPSELALTSLADSRPLRVEVDADWNRPLLRHLEPDGLWFRFAAHSPGRVDRANALPEVQRAVRRVVARARRPDARDERTLQRVASDIARQAAVALALGDRAPAKRWVRQLAQLDPAHPELPALRARLGAPSNAAPSNVGQAMRVPDVQSAPR